MSIPVLWDRFFWSFMLMVLVGLVWLKVVGDEVRYLPAGLLVGLVAGGAWFALGLRSMIIARRRDAAAAARADDEAAAARAEDAEQLARAIDEGRHA